jgi:hypothetical protein
MAGVLYTWLLDLESAALSLSSANQPTSTVQSLTSSQPSTILSSLTLPIPDTRLAIYLTSQDHPGLSHLVRGMEENLMVLIIRFVKVKSNK